MTRYYLEVLQDGLSICVDSDINYHHHFKVGYIISINMYSDKGPKVVFCGFEYDAKFNLDCNPELTWSVERDKKLNQLL